MPAPPILHLQVVGKTFSDSEREKFLSEVLWLWYQLRLWWIRMLGLDADLPGTCWGTIIAYCKIKRSFTSIVSNFLVATMIIEHLDVHNSFIIYS